MNYRKSRSDGNKPFIDSEVFKEKLVNPNTKCS